MDVQEALNGRTFGDPTLSERFLQANGVAGVSRDIDDYQSDAEMARNLQSLYDTTGQEPTPYEPFFKVVNRAACLYRAQRPDRKGRQAVPLLRVYGRETLNELDGAAPLRPSLVCPTDMGFDWDGKERLSWKNMSVVGEIESSWPALVAKIGTYNRALLSVRPERSFFLSFAFNQSTVEVRFLFFHAGGLASSPIARLRTEDGRRIITRGVRCGVELQEGLCAWDFRQRSLTGAILAPFDPLVAKECLHARNSLAGRQSSVRHSEASGSSIEPAEPTEPLQTPISSLASGTRRRCPRSLTSRALKGSPDHSTTTSGLATVAPFAAQSDAYRYWLQAYGLIGPTPAQGRPETTMMAAKDAWAPLDYANEAQLHLSVSGGFGLANIAGHPFLDTNKSIHHDDIEEWDAFGVPQTAMPVLDRDVRNRVVMYMLPKVLPLYTSPTPRVLIEAVFHAMLGHYGLYMERKMVHRDVSCDSILRLSPGQHREAPLSPQSSNMPECSVKCTGVLIDADLSRIDSTPAIDGTTISGTWRFTAHRLMRAAEIKSLLEMEGKRRTESGPPELHHSPVDDIESAIWVIVWEVLRHLTLTGVQRLLFRKLSQTDLSGLAGAKSTIIVHTVTKPLFPQLLPVGTLVTNVLKAILEAERNGIPLPGGDDNQYTPEQVQEVYAVFFRECLTCLSSTLKLKDTDSCLIDMEWRSITSSR